MECVLVLPSGKAPHLGTECLHKQSVGISVCDTHPCFLAAGPWIISMRIFAVLLLKLVAQGLATPEISVLHSRSTNPISFSIDGVFLQPFAKAIT